MLAERITVTFDGSRDGSVQKEIDELLEAGARSSSARRC